MSTLLLSHTAAFALYQPHVALPLPPPSPVTTSLSPSCVILSLVSLSLPSPPPSPWTIPHSSSVGFTSYPAAPPSPPTCLALALPAHRRAPSHSRLHSNQATLPQMWPRGLIRQGGQIWPPPARSAQSEKTWRRRADLDLVELLISPVTRSDCGLPC